MSLRIVIVVKMPTSCNGSGSRLEGRRFTRSQHSAAFLPHPLVQQTMHDKLSPTNSDTEIVNSTRPDQLFLRRTGIAPTFRQLCILKSPDNPCREGQLNGIPSQAAWIFSKGPTRGLSPSRRNRPTLESVRFALNRSRQIPGLSGIARSARTGKSSRELRRASCSRGARKSAAKPTAPLRSGLFCRMRTAGG